MNDIRVGGVLRGKGGVDVICCLTYGGKKKNDEVQMMKNEPHTSEKGKGNRR